MTEETLPPGDVPQVPNANVAIDPTPVAAGSADAAPAADVHAEDAAPSSTEPAPAAPVVVAESSTVAPVEAGNAAPVSTGETVSVAVATGEVPNVESPSSQPSPESAVSTSAGESPNAAPAAAEPTTEPVSAPSVDGAATTSPSVESSPVETVKLTPEESTHFEAVMTDPPAPNEALKAAVADAKPAYEPTFAQRVEQRFLALEQALMGMPNSIHAVMNRGSMASEDFGKAVLEHLFSK